MNQRETVSNEPQRKDFEAVNRPMGMKEWLLIVVLSVIWGGSFFFNEIAVAEITPMTIVMGRVGIAAVILSAYVYLSGNSLPRSFSIWGAFLVMGMINNSIPFSLIVWGQKHIDSSLASILNATTPIFGVVLTHFLTREERLTANRIVGVLVGWFGVTVLIGVESLRGFGVHVVAQLAVLGAALAYALAAVYGRRFKGLPPVTVAAGMLIGATIMMIPLAMIIEQPWHLNPGISAWLAVVALAVLSTSVAYILYFRVLATAGVTNLLLVTFLIPLSAILLGVLILGERPGWNVFGGMLLIFSGLILIDGRLVSHYRAKDSAIPGSNSGAERGRLFRKESVCTNK